MKAQKGVTLISVTIYVLVMAIVVGIIATISSFFYTNVTTVDEAGKNAAEYSNFNRSFLIDVKEKGNKVKEIALDGSYLLFSNNVKYTVKNGAMYRDNVKVCDNVKSAKFMQSFDYEKTIITVEITIGEKDPYYSKKDYVMIP